MRALYTLAIFLGSALLFLVQPMVAKMILPIYGGAPAVWNASMVFFQAILLAGYGYAHLTTKWLGVRRQSILHLVVMIIAAIPLIAVPAGFNPNTSGLPTALSLLLLLGGMVGLPFFAVSAGAPLLQRWFAATDDPAAKDPYFLYSASNVGSVLALLAYPFLIEPSLALSVQSQTWRGIYVGLIVLMAFAAIFLAKRSGQTDHALTVSPEAEPSPAPSFRQRLNWVLLSAVPSSLLLGATAYITANVASIPLLWVIPLTLYLLTFVIAFKKKPLASSDALGRVVALLLAPMALLMVLQSSDPLWLIALLHLATFFFGALFCHTRLAEERPSAARLTEFYFFLSLGGVIGGAFTSLLAPVLFNGVYEYPVAMVALLLLRRPRPDQPQARGMDLAYPVLVAAITGLAIFLANRFELWSGGVRTILTIGLPVILAFVAVDRPLRYGLAIGAFLWASAFFNSTNSADVLYSQRSFFGVHKVTQRGEFHELVHGNTVHGKQSTDPEASGTALTYYYPTGPAGQVILAMQASGRLRDAAFVGLGVGSLTAYGRAGDNFTYYEIDPTIVDTARNAELFTYLSNAKANMQITLGDARLMLNERPNASYDIIVLDAFTSDAIPVHLLTLEAIRMYFDKLRPNGLLLIHISNRYLDLSQPVQRAANALGLVARYQADFALDEESEAGKFASTYMLLARDEAALGAFNKDSRWSEVDLYKPGRPWTDDYSNVFEVFDWNLNDLGEAFVH